MNSKQIKNWIHSLGKTANQKSPMILAAMGIGAGISAVGLGIEATIKATKKVEAENRSRDTKMNKKEIFQSVWKFYIPTVVTSMFSTACIIGSYSAHAKQNMALAAAYKLSETAFTEFREKAVEEIGVNKVNDIQKKIANRHMEETPAPSREVPIVGSGSVLCFDDYSGRYFKCDRETIRKAANDCNDILKNEMYVSLNEFYGRIGLPYTSGGSEVGWNIDQFPFNVLFDTKIADNGEPCLVVTYDIGPRMDYCRSW